MGGSSGFSGDDDAGVSCMTPLSCAGGVTEKLESRDCAEKGLLAGDEGRCEDDDDGLCAAGLNARRFRRCE